MSSERENYSPEILNAALRLATQWGSNAGKPIGGKIKAEFPDLTDKDVNDLETMVKKAEYFIYDLAEQELAGLIPEANIVPTACKEFQWIDEQQADRLKNIGMYYARR